MFTNRMTDAKDIKIAAADDRARDNVQTTELAHVRNQTAMYLGGKPTLESSEYVMDEKERIHLEKLRYSPACLKCIDEPIVNAIDQWTDTRGNTDIWITFEEDGYVTIKNTGSCVGVFMNKTSNGRSIYNPQMMFGEFRSSTRYDLSKDSVVGGVNGLGIKLTNSFSTEFTVETVDPKYQIKYIQDWFDCMSRVAEPELSKSDEPAYTKVCFMLNFEDFEMKGAQKAALIEQLRQMVYMRAVHTSIYISPRRVYWNNAPVQTCTLNQFARKYLTQVDVQMVEFAMTNAAGHNWRVALVPKDNNHGLEHMTIINGINARSGGSHVDWIVDQIIEYVKPLVMKMAKDDKARFVKQNVLKHIMIFMTGQINKPIFTGQRKDEIRMDSKNFEEFKIPHAYLNAYWMLLKPFIEFDAIQKSLDDQKTKKKRRVKAKKYEAAKYAGGARSDECSLFIAEGDTAFGIIDDGITSNKKTLDFNRYGIFSIQGVPVNARREVKYKTNPKTGERVLILSKKIKENERWNALIEVLGLDYNKKYATTDERSTLRYGHAIIATDQDKDGRGNISSLLVNNFLVFWPELVRHGFLQFIITPIVRAYHRKGTKKVMEFFTDEDYRKWDKQQEDAKEYEVVYYKGLGSHSEMEVEKMFSTWPAILRSYALDDEYEKTCDIYMGSDADKRKKVLIHPPEGTEDEYYDDNGRLCVTDHFNTSTKDFQIYNISRHIPSDIDGMIPSKRKCLAGSRKRFRAKNERLKVFQLGGYVIEKMNYHHGDASLSDTLIHMAQCYKGAREFPFLRALSKFGSRKKGGTDAGQPRYIYTKLNSQLVNAMFPAIDDYLLQYTFDDGKRGEPEYYVPIVPLAILESYKGPGHGWASTIWARDYASVSAWVRESVRLGEPADRKEDFPVSDWYMKHQIQTIRGVQNSIGTYVRKNENTITITELPMKVWNVHFTDGNPDKKTSTGLKDDPNVVSVHDTSDGNNIRIEVKFKPGFLDKLQKDNKDGKMDPIVTYLDLKQSLKENLSMMGRHGAVVEYVSYLQIAKQWFTIRKQLYKFRVERMGIILRLKIMMNDNQQRYATNRHTYKINKIKRVDQVRILADEKYQTVDHKLLAEPEYTDVGKLEELIMRGPQSDYSYLLRMNGEDLSEEGQQSLQEKKQELVEQLTKLTAKDTFPGAKLWMAELDKLDEIVRLGRASDWMHWDVKPKW